MRGLVAHRLSAIADTARAKFVKGVLEVTVDAPPREVSRGRKIEISS